MLDKLCDIEIELLRHMNGEKTSIGGWGSWMTGAIEAMEACGLIERVFMPLSISYVITEAGRAALREREGK